MHYEKPGGAIHEVLRRAFDELRLHNNPQATINIVTCALATAEGLPFLPSGKDLNGDAAPSTLGAVPSRGDAVVGRVRDATSAVLSGGVSRGASGGCDDGMSRPRQGGPGSVARAPPPALSPTSSVQWVGAGTVGIAAATCPLPAQGRGPASASSSFTGGMEWLGGKSCRFNRTQVLRLLLLRCEAHSVMKQYQRALQDAQNAVEISQGQSAEAYFALGREYRHQFDIVESVSAFDKAEVLLDSMQQAIALGKNVVDGWSPAPESDEEFWAERGYHMSEVQQLGFTRRECELQERVGYGTSFSNPNSVPASPLRGSSQVDPSIWTEGGAAAARRRSGCSDSALGSAVNPALQEAPLSRCDSLANRSVTGNGTSEGFKASNYVRDLFRCGMSPNELAMWRRLANDSRALLAMRQSHTVPSSVLGATLTLLSRRMGDTRGGLVVSVENNASMPLRFVGAQAPAALYHDSFSFPDSVAKSYCGVAMLHPRGWGGYSGFVCYELQERLSCFLYFDCPLLGSRKCGVRFVEDRASDLRRAFAELYNESGVYGIEGGTTASAINPSLLSNGSGMSQQHTARGGFGNSSGNTSHCASISIRGATTPLTTTTTSMSAARAAVSIPPTHTWITSRIVTTATTTCGIKATARLNGSQGIAFTLSEMLPVQLRSVELLPALEYVGAATLKKISWVNRRYRELINHLPPPLFFSPGRRSYPDYCCGFDCFSSPWIVRDTQPVTWKLVFDGRIGDHEEFSISDDGDMQKHILCFAADAQTKVTGYIYFGDKRCLQYIIKESWVPFTNTLYISTPLGRTFASFVATNSQTQFSLCLSSSATSNGSVPNRGDEALYTARKCVGLSSEDSTSSPSPFSGAAVTARASSSAGGRSSAAASRSGVPLGVVTGVVEGVDTDGSAKRACVSTAPSVSSSSSLNVRTDTAAGGVRGLATSTMAGPIPQAALASLSQTSSSQIHVAPNVGSSESPIAAVKAGAVSAVPVGRPECYSIWRSQRVSGGALVGSAVPRATNGGADIVAEVKTNTLSYGVVAKGYCAAEIVLLPGADAMLVSIMAFLMTRM